MRLQFGWSPSARTFRLSPAPDTPRVSSRSGDRKKNNDDGPDHDEYDIITPQTDREVFSKRTDQSQSGPFSHQSSMLPTRPLPLGGSNANNSTDGSKVILKGNANSDYAPPKTQSSQPWHQFSEADSKLNNFGDSWRYRPNADDGLAGSESSRQQREKADANSTGPDDSWRQGLGVDTKPNDFYDPLHINVPDGKDVTTVAHDQHRTNEDMPKEQLQDHSEEQAGGQQSRQETTLISTPGPENQEADIVVQSPGKREWDFILPEVTSTGRTGLGRGVQRFDIREVVALIQGKSDERTVEMYFENYDKHIIQSCIKQDVEGFPSIFYAAATNNDRILRSWIANGADVNAVHEDSGTPLLAFVIINSEHIEEDTTDIVATLLSTGASPLAIAESFYKPYNQDLPEDGPSDEDLELCGSRQTTWLHSTAKRKLASNLNLTHRYNLERASRTPKPSVRQKQVAERNKAEGLLGLPYFLIGQSLAANRLLQTCINHLADRKERPKPLVIVFAGPSGHGKTELARRLGYLMSLELEVVDCTIVTREMELFGGRHPYVNAGEGTPINNFLARNSGQRCIVFMDEFEKTTKEIHQALLLPFDNGEYQDRRNLKKIDCSKTIWILATNALDRRIRDFCKVNEAVLFDDDEVENKTRLMKELDRDLKNDFLAKFDVSNIGLQ